MSCFLISLSVSWTLKPWGGDGGDRRYALARWRWLSPWSTVPTRLNRRVRRLHRNPSSASPLRRWLSKSLLPAPPGLTGPSERLETQSCSSVLSCIPTQEWNLKFYIYTSFLLNTFTSRSGRRECSSHMWCAAVWRRWRGEAWTRWASTGFQEPAVTSARSRLRSTAVRGERGQLSVGMCCLFCGSSSFVSLPFSHSKFNWGW